MRDYFRLKWIGERLFRGRASRFSRFLSIAGLGGGLWQVSRGAEIPRFDGCESGSAVGAVDRAPYRRLLKKRRSPVLERQIMAPILRVRHFVREMN